MMKNQKFVVITEIYLNDLQISRNRSIKSFLSIEERDHLIRSLFNQRFGIMKMMDIYASISVELNEKYGIDICERTVMRILKKI